MNQPDHKDQKDIPYSVDGIIEEWIRLIQLEEMFKSKYMERREDENECQNIRESKTIN